MMFLRCYSSLVLTPTETVVCGDFNTKCGDPTCTDAVNLADLLDTAVFLAIRYWRDSRAEQYVRPGDYS